MTSDREIRVAPREVFGSAEPIVRFLALPLFIGALLFSESSLFRQWEANLTIIFLTLFLAMTSFLEVTRKRQIWRFDHLGATLTCGRRSERFVCRGLVLEPFFWFLYARARLPDGRKRLVPVPSSESGLRTAFLNAMSQRGAGIRCKEWIASGELPATESLRTRLKDSLPGFADAEIVGLIGFGVLLFVSFAVLGGQLVTGILIVTALVVFTLMLYPRAFKIVRKRASDKPLNELLHDLKFEGTRVTALLLDGKEWQADLLETALLQEERQTPLDAFEHRLVLRSLHGAVQVLTPWECSPQESTSWIRGALVGRGVPFRPVNQEPFEEKEAPA